MKHFLPHESAHVGRPLRWLTLLAALLLVPGCGGDGGQLDVYPVRGTVTYQGKPIEGAKVMLFGQDEHLRAVGVPIPEATTDIGGTFELTTYAPGDGAPEGNYNVSITWMEETGPADDPELVTRRDRLKNRYASPDSSGLTATVEEDDNELPPFELQ